MSSKNKQAITKPEVLKQNSKQVAIQVQSAFVPCPPPDLIERYKEADPRFVDLFIKLAEDSNKEILKRESLKLTRPFDENRRGQIFAFVISVFSLLVCGYGMYLNSGIVAFSPILINAGLFIDKFLSKKDK